MENMERTEMDKLIAYLYKKYEADESKDVLVKPCCGGLQVIVTDKDDNWLWDAVCHPHSYGGKRGLIEVMEQTKNNYVLTEEERECDDVLGYLTAEDIIKRLES